MKEIKAYIHRHRVADVIRALKDAGFRNLSFIDVRGMMRAINEQEQEDFVGLAEKITTEVKLELVCDDEQRTAQAVNIIRENARTGRPDAGWIYISEITAALSINDEHG